MRARAVLLVAAWTCGCTAPSGDAPRHPGSITYVDGATQEVIRVAPVEEVPEALRFADTAEGEVPIVRVVRMHGAERSEILEYGPDGELLRVTVGR